MRAAGSSPECPTTSVNQEKEPLDEFLNESAADAFLHGSGHILRAFMAACRADQRICTSQRVETLESLLQQFSNRVPATASLHV